MNRASHLPHQKQIRRHNRSGTWRGGWVYWLGPVVGALAGVAVDRFAWLRRMAIAVAQRYQFEHDPHGIFCPVRLPERRGDEPHRILGHR